MNASEVYRAQSDRALEFATENQITPFHIEIQFLGGLSDTQQAAFKGAADRWAEIIVSALPDDAGVSTVNNALIIEAVGDPMDGVGGTLGGALVLCRRGATVANISFLPSRGIMIFDTADLEALEQRGLLDDVIVHEMGHVIGLEPDTWLFKGLVTRPNLGSDNPVFNGANAMREYGALLGTAPQPVPLEDTGGAGTRGAHWRESVFENELMTGFVDAQNFISRVTVGCLQDMGYVVDYDAADAYALPAPIGGAGIVEEKPSFHGDGDAPDLSAIVGETLNRAPA